MFYFKKWILPFFGVLLLGLLCSSVMAQTSGNEAVDIRYIHISAKGILVNADDSMDIHSSKIISATFKPKGPEPSSSEKGLDRGIITYDKTKYTIKDIIATSTTFSANIYDKNVLIGSISLSFVDTPDTIVWAGKAIIKDVTYYAYYLQYSNVFIPVKQVKNVKEYCNENPNAFGCNRVRNCEQNPNSEECLPLWREYCLKNAQDVRCKQYLKKLCEENPSLDFCVVQVDSKEGTFFTARIEAQNTWVERLKECKVCKLECWGKCVRNAREDYIPISENEKSCLKNCIEGCEKCYVTGMPIPLAGSETDDTTSPSQSYRLCGPPYECMSKDKAAENGCTVVENVGFAMSKYICDSGLVCVKCPTEVICPEAPSSDSVSCEIGKIVPKYDKNKCIIGYECMVPKACFCPMIYDPVCGTDGKTYGNSCEAACAGVNVVYKGRCGTKTDSEQNSNCLTVKRICTDQGCYEFVYRTEDCPDTSETPTKTPQGPGYYPLKSPTPRYPIPTPTPSPFKPTPILTPYPIPSPTTTPYKYTTPSPACQYLYWFDNQNKTCGYKQFCGLYMYEGLKTFGTLKECEKALCSPYDCVAKSVAEKYKCLIKGDVPCSYTGSNEPKYCYSCGYTIQG